MASQWGRDTTFQPRRGNAGLIIVVAILALAIGFAGAYAAFRYLEPQFVTQPDINPPPVEADPEIARLTEALALASRDLEASRTAEASRLAEVEELTAQTARQASELDAIAERLAQMSSEAGPPIIETAAAVASLTRERDALAAQNQSLTADLATLEAEREAARQEAADVQARLEGEIARLTDEVVPDLTAERDTLQRQVSLLLAEQAALGARLKAAEQGRTDDARRMAELETRLEDSARELASAQAALAALEAAQAAEPAVAEPGAVETNAATETPEPDAQTQAAPALTPRDPQAVAAALRSAPGIGLLSAADRQLLTERLVAGECVTTALEAVFNRVPILTLRNLIRDLNSDC